MVLCVKIINNFVSVRVRIDSVRYYGYRQRNAAICPEASAQHLRNSIFAIFKSHKATTRDPHERSYAAISGCENSIAAIRQVQKENSEYNSRITCTCVLQMQAPPRAHAGGQWSAI